MTKAGAFGIEGDMRVTLAILIPFLGFFIFICTISPASAADSNQAELDRASQLVTDGKYDEAIEICNAVIAKDPNSARALVIRARANCPFDMEAKMDGCNWSGIPQTGSAPNIASRYLGTADLDFSFSSLNPNADKKSSIDDCLRAIEINPKFAPAYVQSAIAQLLSGNFDEAGKYLNKAIEDFPNDYNCYLHRGFYSLLFETNDLAISYLKKACELNPTDYRPYRYMAWCLYRKGECDDAILLYGVVLKLKPDFAEAYLERGNLFLIGKKYDESIADIEKAVKLAPGSGDVYAARARAKFIAQKGDNASIRADIDMAMQKALDGYWANLCLALLYYEIGDKQKALEVLGKAVELRPSAQQAYAFRYAIYLELGDDVSAERDYSKALEIAPKDPYLYVMHSKQFSAKDDDKRFADLAKALEINPNIDLPSDRWMSLLIKGDYQGAYAEATEMITHFPNKAEGYSLRSGSYRYDDKDRYKKALPDISKAIELEPQNYQYYASRGKLHFDNGVYMLAVEDYTKAISIGPEWQRFYYLYFRGQALAGMGQFDLAIEDFSEVIKLVSDLKRKGVADSEAYYAYLDRGKAYEGEGEYELALADYSKAMEYEGYGFVTKDIARCKEKMSAK